MNDGTTTVTGTVTLGVTAVNDAPVAADAGLTVNEESVGTDLGLVAPSDVDGDSLTITVTGLPTLGSVTLADGTAVTNGQALTSAQLTGLKYNAPADYNTGDTVGTFTYSVNDGTTTVTGTVTLKVTPVNDAPVAETDSVFVNEGSTSTFGSVLDNDMDADLDSLTVVQFATSNVATPTVANGSNSITTALGGAVVMNADGSFSYIAPVLDHSSSSQRTDSFVYRSSDGELQSGWTTVNIIVLDSAPDTNDDEDSVAIGATITGNVITGEGGDAPGGADIFADAPATVVSVSLGGTTYSIPAGGRTLVTANGTLVIQQDGSYSYTAMGQINVDSSESVDRFDYRLADGDGTISAPATLTITAGNSISFSYAENQAMGAVLGTVQATSPSGHAVSYAITGGNADGYFTINSAGGISLTPAGATSLANDYEALDNLHSLTVTVTSSAGVSRDIAVSLAETDRNDAPVNSLPVNYTMDEDTTLKLSGLSVADIDAGAGSISVTLSVSRGTLTAATANGVTVSGSGSSSVVLSGTLANINAYLADAATQPAYTPLLDDSGTVALTMTSNDLGNSGPGGALTDTDSIDITINRVADALEGSNVALLVGAPVANTLDFGSNITGLQSKNNYSFPSGILLSTGDPTKTFNWSTGNLLGVTSPGENGTESQRINDADKIELNFPTGMQYMALKLKNAGNDSILIRSDLQVGELTGGVLSGTITSSSGITLSSTNLKVSLILEVAGQVTPVTVQATVNSGGTWSVSYSGVTGTITKATVAAYLDGSLFNQGGNTSANVSYSISSDMQSLSIAQDTLNTYSKNNDGFQIEYIDLSAAPSGTTTYSYPIDLYGVIQDAVGTPESFSGLTLSDLPAGVALSIWSEDDQAYHEIAPDAQGVYDLSAYSDLLSTPTVSGTDKIYLVSAGLLPSGFAPTLTVEIADGASIAKTILGGSADSTFAGSVGNDYISGGAGIDTLIGNEGNDILLGGTGADRFVWQTGDTGQDVLKDFNASEGDRIDLSDLLQGENALNILDYLRVDTATSTLQISSAGTLAADGSNADVTIRLENGGLGVDLNPGGLSHDDLVSSLIAGGDPLVKIG
ncbi:Poly(beta-D-mannuronate) C5 epimerase 1 [compost metagenome]